jgi:anaerobic glycerol-3-phosphate dehydrogenase
MQTQLVWKITYANVVTITVPQTEQLRRQPAYMRGVGTTEVLEL